MKKLLSLMLAASMLIGCALTLSSCFFAPKPELDLKEAKKALEKEDYTVSYADKEDLEDVPYVEERLSAYNDEDSLMICIYADAKSAELHYKRAKLDRDAAIAEFEQEIEELELELAFYENILDKYEDDLDRDDIKDIEDEIEDLMDELEDVEKELKEYKEEYVIGKSGKTVWYGTKDAIEDSKR